MLSVNGKPPSKKEVKNFDREHVYRADYRIDSATLKVIRDDEKQLLIGYQYDPASLDSDHSFLKDCQFTFVINTETGVLERITQKNLKELKVKIVKMPKLTGESVFKFSSKHGNYLIVQQEVVAVMRLAGSQTSLITTDKYEYDDF